LVVGVGAKTTIGASRADIDLNKSPARPLFARAVFTLGGLAANVPMLSKRILGPPSHCGANESWRSLGIIMSQPTTVRSTTAKISA
jgi:hypothetical protein